MRIGIDARFYGSLGKGLGRYTEKLLQELERQPGEDQFVVFLRRENFDEYQPVCARFTKALADYPWYGWREQWLFPRLLRQHRLDLMHFPHFNVPLIYRQPFVVTIHDLILFHYPTVKASELSPFLYWLKYLVYRFVIAQAIGRARRVFAVSQFTADDIARAYPQARQKICVTREAADPFCFWLPPSEHAACLKRLGLTKHGQGKPFVLYVGNAYPHKNLELLLELAASQTEKLFVCVGKEDYFYIRLRHSATARGLDNVLFVGFVADRELSILYREAECYFFPSLYEGFGLPALEAFTYGTPVVAARRGSLPEVLGEAAVFFEPTDKASLLAGLRAVTENIPLRTERIRRGYLQAATYSWSRMALNTLREYHRSKAPAVYAGHSTQSIQ